MTVEKRAIKTIQYLNSKTGKKNWQLNVFRGYTDRMNLIAAIQTATRIIKYEAITDVYNSIMATVNTLKAA